MAETLKEKTARGLLWGGLNSGLQQLLGLLFDIVLGRLLSPDDYGMIAMIAIFSLVANELQNSGFKVALANLREPRAEDYNSVFWTNIAIGAVLYVVLFAAAPLIAAFYPEELLVELSRVLFLGFFIASTAEPPKKEMSISRVLKRKIFANSVARDSASSTDWQLIPTCPIVKPNEASTARSATRVISSQSPAATALEGVRKLPPIAATALSAT